MSDLGLVGRDLFRDGGRCGCLELADSRRIVYLVFDEGNPDKGWDVPLKGKYPSAT